MMLKLIFDCFSKFLNNILKKDNNSNKKIHYNKKQVNTIHKIGNNNNIGNITNTYNSTEKDKYGDY